MDSAVFSTNNGNNYLHSINNEQFMYLHPILVHLLSIEKNGVDLQKFINSNKGNEIYIDGYGNCTWDEVKSNLEKLSFLKEEGYFESVDISGNISYKITPRDIESALSNLTHCTFEVTERCNIKCTYCTYGQMYMDYDPRKKKDLTASKAKKFLEFMFTHWNSDLNTSHQELISIGFYGGEPLLNIKFIEEIVKYIDDFNTGGHRFSFHMTTNGLLLDKYLDFLVQNNFSILISLDGDENNNEYRFGDFKKSHYDKIIQTIYKIKDNYPDFYDANVSFHSVLHKKNSYKEIYQYFKTNFGKIPSIAELVPVGVKPSEMENFQKIYLSPSESRKDMGTEIQQFELENTSGQFEDITNLIHLHSGYVFNKYKDLINCDKKRNSIPTGTCIPFSKKVFITANGKILPCERIGHQFGLGMVDSEKVDLDLEIIADYYNSQLDKIRKKCRSCYANKICGLCIFYMKEEGEHLKCKGFLNNNEYSKYLSSSYSYLEDNPGVYRQIMETSAL
jgi:uncharacterized protein